MIYKVDMYYFNKKNETNEGDTWLQGLPYPLTAYKVSSLYCGNEEDVRKHLNLVTGNLNKHLFH